VLADPAWARVILVALILLTGLTVAYLPLTWAVALILGTGALILIFVRPVVGLYLLIFAIPLGSLKEISVGVISVGGAEALAAVTILAWGANMIAKREIRTLHPPLLVPMVVFLAVISFSLLAALSLQWGLKGLLVWLELLAIYLFVVNVVDERDVKIIVVLILVAGSMEALLGFYQFFGGYGPQGFLLFDRFIRAYGTFEQPNPYGGYLALILPLALGLFLARWHRRDMWSLFTWGLAGLSLGLMGSALVMSWSRGAMLGFLSAIALIAVAGFWYRVFNGLTCGALTGIACGGLAALWLGASSGGWVLALVLGGLCGLGAGWAVSIGLQHRWGWLLAALVVLFGGMFILVGGDRFLPAALSQRFSDLLPYLSVTDVRAEHLTDENYAVVERWAHWQAALDMLSDHPLLGVGIGNYVPLYPAYNLPGWEDPMGHAHNHYLNVAAETGLLGLVAYLWFLLASLWNGWRSVSRTREQWRGITLGILGVLGALAVHSLFDNLYVHGMNMHLAILLGVIYVLSERGEAALVKAS
jgi:hypothetical protein